MRRTLADHAARLQRALAKATAEHGAPNSFAFGELHQLYGGPPPMLAGRAAKLIPGLEVRRGRVYVEPGT